MADSAAFVFEQRVRCHDQRRVPARIMGFVSVATCVVALISRLRTQRGKPLKFPENTFILGLGSLVVCHLSMLIGVVDGSAHLKSETAIQRAVCQAQAAVMHWTLITLMLNAIYVVVALYLLVVRRVALSTIAQATRSFYLIVVGIPTLTVVACMAVGQGYVSSDDDMCWIRSGPDRLVLHLSFMALGVAICAGLTPALLWSLWKAYRTVDDPSRARIFRSMMIRLMVVSLYVVLLFGISLLTSLNQSILESASDASSAARYAKKTLFLYCMLRTFVVSSMGLVVATILSVKKRHTRGALALLKKATRSCRIHRPAAKIETSDLLIDAGHHNSALVSKKSADLSSSSPLTTGGRLHCPSAAEPGGRTAVSIPPDPSHHRAHLIATHAYTSYVLEHAREQLQAQHSLSTDSSGMSHRALDSGLSGSSFLSHASYLSAATPRRRTSSAISPPSDIKVATEL